LEEEIKVKNIKDVILKAFYLL